MKHKKLKITVFVILAVVILLFLSYKLAYNTLAPVVFDYIVGKNPEALLKIEQWEEPKNYEQTPDNTEPQTEETSQENQEQTESKEQTQTQQEQSGVYSSETSIGALTTNDLVKVIKEITPADKTRIISICKSIVSPADMPRFAKMAKSGMKGDDYAFAENYLRSRLSASQKEEILNIVRKYLGR